VPTRYDSPVVRLKRRIADRLDEDRDKPMALRRTQKGLADKLGVTKSTLHEMLNGHAAQQGALARLDVIADYLGMSPAELVKSERSRLMELSIAEQRIIQQWRDWPREVRATVLRLFDYFGGLLPEEQEAREYGYLLRQIKDPDLRARMVGALRDAVNSQRKWRPASPASDADTHRSHDTTAGARRHPGQT